MSPRNLNQAPRPPGYPDRTGPWSFAADCPLSHPHTVYTRHTLRRHTSSDVCWMTRVTLHAIERMPQAEIDVILMSAIIAQDAASADRGIVGNPAQVPLPSPATGESG
jgi:hypothetical protein